MTANPDQDLDLLKLGFEGEQAITAELYQKHGRSYDAKQIVIREGDFGREVYLVISGRVVVTEKVERGSYKVLNSLGPGEIFGEMALIEGAPRSATLIAAAPTRLLALQEKDFATIFQSHPRWAFKILGALGRRIQTAFKVVERHYGQR
ncbi:MAG: cyclic nucleotide-binding domain-containing protein [Leptospirales bacterium]|jgi:CRP/FNR family cyclic AMP-dependent transcriptional regulator